MEIKTFKILGGGGKKLHFFSLFNVKGMRVD